MNKWPGNIGNRKLDRRVRRGVFVFFVLVGVAAFLAFGGMIVGDGTQKATLIPESEAQFVPGQPVHLNGPEHGRTVEIAQVNGPIMECTVNGDHCRVQNTWQFGWLCACARNGYIAYPCGIA